MLCGSPEEAAVGVGAVMLSLPSIESSPTPTPKAGQNILISPKRRGLIQEGKKTRA